MRRVFFTISLFFGLIYISEGQEMLGIENSNYAGIYNINLNPSGMVGSKLYMDYNFLSFNFFAGTNFAFIKGSDFADMLYNGISPTYYTEKNELRNFDIYRKNKLYDGYQNIRLNGPGGMLVYGKHALGLTSSIRESSFFNNLPNDMGQFIYEAIDFQKQQNILWSHDKTIHAGSLTWLEISLSYAYNFHRYKWDYWAVGISVKPLIGISGIYSNLYNVDYYVQHDDTAYIDNLSFDYSYSLPINYDDNTYEGPFFSGFGWGVDLGITYMFTAKGHTIRRFTRLCAQRYEDYNVKIGLSLLDIGYIKFKKRAEVHSFLNTNTDWFRNDYRDNMPSGSMNEINEKLEAYFSDYSGQSLSENKFTIYTPPTISLQIDYHFKRYMYLNGTFFYGFSYGDNILKRPSVFSLTYRYEKLRWEFALPVSVVELNYLAPKAGFYFRYGNFFLGTNDFISFLGLKDFTAIDFYFGLRLNLSRNLRMDYFKGNCGDANYYNIETFDYRNF